MDAPAFERWLPALDELVEGIRVCTAEALRGALGPPGAPLRAHGIARPVGRGAGDVTFALDLPSERLVERWLEEQARRQPLSVLTEDSGWRHRGPDGSGGARALPGFDHGGPRIAIDPVDGTRNLMADLRSAWTVVSFAAGGVGPPRMDELAGGIVSELPPSRARSWRTFRSDGTSCLSVERELAGGRVLHEAPVVVDADDRVDHGYFPFFRYEPALRPDLARLEAAFFERLVRHEGADARAIYDDQYISNAGQLVLLLGGTYRLVVDARALVGRRRGRATVTSKPYDVAGAILCARAAGCEVTAADGGPLAFPLDAETPVDFAAYANAPTRARLEPHWLEVLRTTEGA